MSQRSDTPPMTYTREEAAAAFEWLRAASLVADIHSHHAAIMFTEIARLKAASSETRTNAAPRGTVPGDINGASAAAPLSAIEPTQRISYRGFSYGMGEDGIKSLRRAIEERGDQ